MAAIEEGTATGFMDLFAKIVGFLTDDTKIGVGNEWTVERDTTSGFTDSGGHVILSTTNVVGATLVVALEPSWDVVSGRYNLVISAGTGYSSSSDRFAQPGMPGNQVSLNHPRMCLQNTSMAYLIIADKEHCIVRAQTGPSCHLGYFGFFEPYAPPSQFTHPIIFGADAGNPDLRWNTPELSSAIWMFKGQSNQADTSYTGSTAPSSWVRGPGGLWYPIRVVTSWNTSNRFCVYSPVSLLPGNNVTARNNTNRVQIDVTEGGDYPMFDITVYIHDTVMSGRIAGNCVPIGKLKPTILWVPGEPLNLGDTIEWNGNEYTLASNWELTHSSAFVALLKGPIAP